MARPTKLNNNTINYICECLKRRLNWKEIAAGLDVDAKTLRNWIKQGKSDQNAYTRGKKTLCHKLHEAVEQTKANLISEYAKLLRKGLTVGTTQKTTKIIIADDGTRRTEITEKEIPPNMADLFKILAIIDPANWSPVQHIKVDWQKPLQDAGVDPEEIQQAYFKWLEERQDETDGAFIPQIPGREV